MSVDRICICHMDKADIAPLSEKLKGLCCGKRIPTQPRRQFTLYVLFSCM